MKSCGSYPQTGGSGSFSMSSFSQQNISFLKPQLLFSSILRSSGEAFSFSISFLSCAQSVTGIQIPFFPLWVLQLTSSVSACVQSLKSLSICQLLRLCLTYQLNLRAKPEYEQKLNTKEKKTKFIFQRHLSFLRM